MLSLIEIIRGYPSLSTPPIYFPLCLYVFLPLSHLATTAVCGCLCLFLDQKHVHASRMGMCDPSVLICVPRIPPHPAALWVSTSSCLWAQVSTGSSRLDTADTAMPSKVLKGREKRCRRCETADRAMSSSRRKADGRRAQQARYGLRFSLATALPLMLLALFQGLLAGAFALLPPRLARWQAAETATGVAPRRRHRGRSTNTGESRPRPGDSSGHGEAASCRQATVLSMGGSVEEEWPFHKSRYV